MAVVINKQISKALLAGKEELKKWLADSGFGLNEDGSYVNEDGDSPQLEIQDLIDFFVFGAEWGKK